LACLLFSAERERNSISAANTGQQTNKQTNTNTGVKQMNRSNCINCIARSVNPAIYASGNFPFLELFFVPLKHLIVHLSPRSGPSVKKKNRKIIKGSAFSHRKVKVQRKENKCHAVSWLLSTFGGQRKRLK